MGWNSLSLSKKKKKEWWGLKEEKQVVFKDKLINHLISLVWLLLYKYKYLWDVSGKGQGSSLQKGASHTHTHIDKVRIEFLSYIKKKKKRINWLKKTSDA